MCLVKSLTKTKQNTKEKQAMTNTVKNINVKGNGVVAVNRKIHNTAWPNHNTRKNGIAYKYFFDVSGLTGQELIDLAVNSLVIRSHVPLKKLTEQAALAYLKQMEGKVIDVRTFYKPAAVNPLFKELSDKIATAREWGGTDEMIISKYAAQYGQDNVEAVIRGENPYTTEPEEEEEEAIELDEAQKADVLNIAKMVKEEMKGAAKADKLMEVFKRCGFAEKFRKDVFKYAQQIIK